MILKKYFHQFHVKPEKKASSYVLNAQKGVFKLKGHK